MTTSPETPTPETPAAETPVAEAPAAEAPAAEAPAAEAPAAVAAVVDPVGERSRRRKLIVLLLLLLAFLLLLGVAIWYLLFRQPIGVPPPPGQVVLPTYATALYGPKRPLGVTVSPDGSRIYVGETGGDRLARILDGAGKQLAVLQPPVSTGTDHVPVYLAMDPINGEIYVSDRPTGSIYIYDANGNYLRAYTAPDTLKGWQPLALAFDSAGNFYATDVSTNPQTVLVFDRQGNLTRTIGQTAKMSFPNGVAVDAAGNVYVTDSNNGRLVVFDPSGALVAQIGRGVGEGNLGLPRGIGIGSDGRVYVVDATGQAVYIYAAYKAGANRLEYLGNFGGEGIGDGKFEFPNGLALDARGRIYVVDSGNDRVQVWSY